MRSPATMETAARAGNRREPLTRGKRIVITMLVAVLVTVILGFVALTGQLISMRRHMHEELSAPRDDISGLRNEMRTEFGGLRDEMRTEFGGLRDEMRTEFRGLRDEMRTEFRGLSDRMTRIETLLRIHYGPPPGS